MVDADQIDRRTFMQVAAGIGGAVAGCSTKDQQAAEVLPVGGGPMADNASDYRFYVADSGPLEDVDVDVTPAWLYIKSGEDKGIWEVA
jgi:hypothetical protein